MIPVNFRHGWIEDTDVDEMIRWLKSIGTGGVDWDYKVQHGETGDIMYFKEAENAIIFKIKWA